MCFTSLFFRAMSSPTNKEQFLKQFDNIVRGIVDNKERVRIPVNFGNGPGLISYPDLTLFEAELWEVWVRN